MLSKIGLVITCIVLAVFAMGRVESVAMHRGFSESAVWAQESDDQADDAISPDDNASQADPASQDDAAPQDASGCTEGPASGIYSGTVMDNNLGAGTIDGAFLQCRGKLTGNWHDTFVPPAFFKGTIKSNGAINARMKFHVFGKCGYVFHGVFENGNEIAGSYKLNGCKGMAADGGTFQMTK
jgi:hypothetical protein